MVKYKVGGITTAAGITFVGQKTKVVIRDKDGAFIVRKYKNPSSNKFGNIPFIRGFFRLFNSFKMIAGTVIGKIAFGFAIFGILMAILSFIIGEPASAAQSAAKQFSIGSAIIFAIINLIMILIIVVYTWFIRNLHGLEHKFIETYNQDLDLTIENVKKQRKETPQCGGTFFGILLLIDLIWVGFLGLPSAWVWLLWPSIGFEAFVNARGDKWFNKVLFFPGLLIQKISTGHKVSDKQIAMYLDGFKAFIAQEDSNYYDKHC